MNSEQYPLTTVTIFDTQLFLLPQRVRYRVELLNPSGWAAMIFTPHSQTAPIGSFFNRTAKKTLFSSKGVLPSAPAVSYYMLGVQLLLLPQCIFRSEHRKKSTVQPRTKQTHFYVQRNVNFKFYCDKVQVILVINQLYAHILVL